MHQNTFKCISGSQALLLLSEIIPKWKLANPPCNGVFGQVFKGAYCLCVQILSLFSVNLPVDANRGHLKAFAEVWMYKLACPFEMFD